MISSLVLSLWIVLGRLCCMVRPSRSSACVDNLLSIGVVVKLGTGLPWSAVVSARGILVNNEHYIPNFQIVFRLSPFSSAC